MRGRIFTQSSSATELISRSKEEGSSAGLSQVTTKNDVRILGNDQAYNKGRDYLIKQHGRIFARACSETGLISQGRNERSSTGSSRVTTNNDVCLLGNDQAHISGQAGASQVTTRNNVRILGNVQAHNKSHEYVKRKPGTLLKNNNNVRILGNDQAHIKPNVKIVGHSFIRRLTDDLKRSGSCIEALGLSDYVASLECFGRGGAMVDNILQSFHIGNCHIVILDVGTNDLCDGIGGHLLAQKVFKHAINLLKYKSVKHVKILEILKRAKTRNLSQICFEQERQFYNNTMKNLSETHSCISFAAQPGFENLNKWSSDGIHATTPYGKNAYRSNIRKFVIDACDKM